MTEARGRFQVTVLDNVIYAIGGSNGEQILFHSYSKSRNLKREFLKRHFKEILVNLLSQHRKKNEKSNIHFISSENTFSLYKAAITPLGEC